ncbi:hypothetical protein [Cellulophaga omnivescoria]|uniref:hypothetical protein n=1 Tax=Cellulophaga omnivescoria TaxID=1888890 RepID=UPI0022F07255|nr:hypothetical protein [Cellulophaga omnivescoria]WBU90669.1 hypothetical protein PBN93_06545 [Cellulophaga omnivescoria]
MDQDWIIILLTSTVVSTMVSVGANYFIEKRKYNQEYWKITISKRLEVYESIEKILIYFQSTHIVNDKPCHFAFKSTENYNDLRLQLVLISYDRSWMSDKLYRKLLEINKLTYSDKIENIENFGIEKYQILQAVRDQILTILQEDYLNMPKVKSFFNLKLKEAKNAENQIH